jgi:hypothetical protein
MNMLQHSIHFCGFLMLVDLCLMPNVLEGAWWSQSWHHVVAFANNCWTRSFALGYWLFYFSSVFDSYERKKTFTGKRLSQVSVYVALFTLALIEDSQFLWQLVIILCQTNLLLDQSWWGTWYTLAARGLEELRVNLLLKENSFVSNIILHWSLILEWKFYKLYVLICIMFSSLVKRVFIYNLFYELLLF